MVERVTKLFRNERLRVSPVCDSGDDDLGG